MIELVPKPIRRLARRYIENRGFLHVSAGPPNLHTVMSRRAIPSVATVIDVGASDGRWSAEMMRYLPSAKYLLIEAQENAHGAALRRFKAGHSDLEYEICVAGDHQGEIFFDASDPFGGQASSNPYPQNNIRVRMETVDDLARRHNFKGPFLLKLDTHGFEVPILVGALQVLSQSSMLIIEAYNFTLCPGALRFYELCQYLELRGFRCVDVFDLMVRPLDNAFWQMDMVFLPSSDPIFQSNHFRALQTNKGRHNGPHGADNL